MKTAWCLPLLVGQVFAGAAHASDDDQIWPELSAYIATSPDTRLVLDASYARGDAADTETLDLSAFSPQRVLTGQAFVEQAII